MHVRFFKVPKAFIWSATAAPKKWKGVMPLLHCRTHCFSFEIFLNFCFYWEFNFGRYKVSKCDILALSEAVKLSFWKISLLKITQIHQFQNSELFCFTNFVSQCQFLIKKNYHFCLKLPIKHDRPKNFYFYNVYFL